MREESRERRKQKRRKMRKNETEESHEKIMKLMNTRTKLSPSLPSSSSSPLGHHPSFFQLSLHIQHLLFIVVLEDDRLQQRQHLEPLSLQHLLTQAVRTFQYIGGPECYR